MLELHIGEAVSIQSTAIHSPVLLLGNVGQGKSTTLQKVVLELIKNQETGFMYDPYGDLTRAVKNGIVSERSKQNVVIFDDMISEAEIKKHIHNKFILVYSNKLKIGGRHVRARAIPLIQKFQKYLQKDQWCVVDEVFEHFNDESIDNYFRLSKSGVKVIFSDSSLVNVSEDERRTLITNIDTFIIYKIRNIDAQWLEEHNPTFKAKDIKAIQQYHFQCLHKHQLTYSASMWPIANI